MVEETLSETPDPTLTVESENQRHFETPEDLAAYARGFGAMFQDLLTTPRGEFRRPHEVGRLNAQQTEITLKGLGDFDNAIGQYIGEITDPEGNQIPHVDTQSTGGIAWREKKGRRREMQYQVAHKNPQTGNAKEIPVGESDAQVRLTFRVDIAAENQQHRAALRADAPSSYYHGHSAESTLIDPRRTHDDVIQIFAVSYYKDVNRTPKQNYLPGIALVRNSLDDSVTVRGLIWNGSDPLPSYTELPQLDERDPSEFTDALSLLGDLTKR